MDGLGLREAAATERGKVRNAGAVAAVSVRVQVTAGLNMTLDNNELQPCVSKITFLQSLMLYALKVSLYLVLIPRLVLKVRSSDARSKTRRWQVNALPHTHA